ncbi:MAG: hypothetical protein V1876_04230 [Candidatus Peregrinibacteria bacterium]
MPIESCQHGAEANSDIVVSVKVEPNRPVQVEQTRSGLLAVLQRKYEAEVTRKPTRGELEVRVCHETAKITTETVRGIEKLIRSQGAQVLQN